MFRLRVITASFFPFMENRHRYDCDKLNKPEDVVATGYDRVKIMFSRNELSEPSVEFRSVMQTTLTGTLFGACFGGFIKSREAYLNFMETNQATIFKSTLQAQKKLQNHVTVAYAKGAVYWGWRLGIFTGMYSLISTTISVYRNETSLIEYIAAGIVTGALYKANLGLAASLVGAGLGGVLSIIFGSLILVLLKVAGVTMADIRQALHGIHEWRQLQYDKWGENAAKEKNDDVTRHHDGFVNDYGERKIESL